MGLAEVTLGFVARRVDFCGVVDSTVLLVLVCDLECCIAGSFDYSLHANVHSVALQFGMLISRKL